MSPKNLLALQHTVGNQAVQRVIQRKLMIGATSDPYEQEADRVAEQVVSGQPKPLVQREAAPKGPGSAHGNFRG